MRFSFMVIKVQKLQAVFPRSFPPKAIKQVNKCMYPSVNVWNFGSPQYEPPKSAPQDKLHCSTRILGGRDKKKLHRHLKDLFPKLNNSVASSSCQQMIKSSMDVYHKRMHQNPQRTYAKKRTGSQAFVCTDPIPISS